jgi:hypothetical protein
MKPVAWMSQGGDVSRSADYFEEMGFTDLIPLYTHPVKELTDNEWNKAFDFYCETDEGVLKFDLELRDEWKREQLIRWKEALRKAQE